MAQNHLLLHLDHPYRFGRPHRVSRSFHDGSRLEDAGGKTRWTMPIWLYVSITGVLVYLMISPYY
jgi:hypothetical protein